MSTTREITDLVVYVCVEGVCVSESAYACVP
jgi:hypothetical protein